VSRSTSPARTLQDAWVARLRARDADALREVVDAFGERLTAVVSGILHDQDAVEEVVQDTFSKAWFRIEAFHGGSSLYTWLYRVAVNGAKDHIKARRRRPSSSLDLLEGSLELPSAAPPPVEDLARRELRLAVRDAIADLPVRFRTVLAMREIEGMAYSEIATVLGLSLGTVESRIFRARRRLEGVLVERGLLPESKGTIE
jgi:RNA polymerase sigma-70 factor (ECF subfamily)